MSAFRSDTVHWVDGEPALDEFDIDDMPYYPAKVKDECPICGEPKLMGSKTCLSCYRESRHHDPKWKGSKAWREVHGTTDTHEHTSGALHDIELEEIPTASSDTPSLSQDFYIAPRFTYSPTPLEWSRYSTSSESTLTRDVGL